MLQILTDHLITTRAMLQKALFSISFWGFSGQSEKRLLDENLVRTFRVYHYVKRSGRQFSSCVL